MTTSLYPSTDLFPSDTLFPDSPIPVTVDGYSQPIECALNGLVLTATDDQDVDWVQDTLDGWYGSPGSTLQLTPKLRAPGAWPSPRQSGPRTLVAAGYVEAPTPEALIDALDRLDEAVSVNAFIFTVSESGLVRSCIAYRQDEVLVKRVSDVGATWSVQLSVPDGRRFGAPLTASTPLPSTTGGIRFPLKFPFNFGSRVVSGLCTLVSPGRAVGPVVLRIDGPVRAPQVTHVDSGASLVFSSDLELAAGEWLIVDMEAQEALANGLVSRANYITSAQWSGFAKGVNTWAFAADGVWPDALLTVTATPAWP